MTETETTQETDPIFPIEPDPEDAGDEDADELDDGMTVEGEDADSEPAPDDAPDESDPSEPCEASLEQNRTDYEKVFAPVDALQAMTETKAWCELYATIIEAAEELAANAMDPETSPTETTRAKCQRAGLLMVIDFVKAPITRLRDLTLKLPLFHDQMPWMARFDDDTGQVFLVENPECRRVRDGKTGPDDPDYVDPDAADGPVEDADA